MLPHRLEQNSHLRGSPRPSGKPVSVATTDRPFWSPAGDGDDRYALIGMKIWADGSLFVGNAGLSRPYLNTEITIRRMGMPPALLDDGPAPSPRRRIGRATPADHKQAFASWSRTDPAPLALEPFRAAIAALPPSVFRAKGLLRFIDAPGEIGVFNLVGKRSELVFTACTDPAEPGRLLAIGLTQRQRSAALSPGTDKAGLPAARRHGWPHSQLRMAVR